MRKCDSFEFRNLGLKYYLTKVQQIMIANRLNDGMTKERKLKNAQITRKNKTDPIYCKQKKISVI